MGGSALDFTKKSPALPKPCVLRGVLCRQSGGFFYFTAACSAQQAKSGRMPGSRARPSTTPAPCAEGCPPALQMRSVTGRYLAYQLPHGQVRQLPDVCQPFLLSVQIYAPVGIVRDADCNTVEEDLEGGCRSAAIINSSAVYIVFSFQIRSFADTLILRIKPSGNFSPFQREPRSPSPPLSRGYS